MFNKPSVFNKPPEPITPRNPRSGPALGAAAAQTVTPVPQRDVPAPPPQSSPAEEAERPGESRLIVGPEVKLKGAEILDCDTLVVEGRVEATMDSRVIRIAENGAFSGTVGIDVAEIHGRFDGELTARKQLIVHATGRVSGKIRYGKIFIEEGGEICGDVQSLSSAKEASRPAEREPAPPRVLAAAG